MGFQTQNRRFFSHQVVLGACLVRTKGPVLELGCGYGSTMFLHGVCASLGRELVSFDSHPRWLRSFKFLQRPWHRVEHIKNWAHLKEYKQEWGLVLVDQQPARSRGHSVLQMKDNVEIFVAHDTHKQGNCRFTELFPKFKYKFDYREYKPWTTAVSDKINLDFLEEIDL